MAMATALGARIPAGECVPARCQDISTGGLTIYYWAASRIGPGSLVTAKGWHDRRILYTPLKAGLPPRAAHRPKHTCRVGQAH
jgi:hypothetical protein